MLDSLRSFSRTWFAKILIAVLVVSFAAFGIENVITGLGANVVARVGNEEITAKDFDRAYQDQMNRVAQQFGQTPTAEMATQLGIPSMVISRLAADAAVDTLAKNLGIGVSDQRLGRMLRADPTFGGTLGQFDPANFQRVLQQYGLSESEYFEMQRESARREQVVLSLLGDAMTPQAANEILDRFAGDTRTVDYFLINEQSVLGVSPPSEEDISTYYEAHKAEYRTVEKRRTDLLVLSPDTLATSMDVTPEQIAAEYERTASQLVRPETRTIQQVVLGDEAAIKSAEEALAAGTPYIDLLSTLGVAAIDLGTLAKAGISDPALANAAFDLPEDGYTIIDGIGGKRIIHVSAIVPGSTPTLEEATPGIRQRLALSAARNQYPDILDQVEELHAAGQKVPAIAERFKLPYVTANVSSGGAELTGIPNENKRQVATAIFAAAEGALAPTVTISSTMNVWFDVTAIEPARDLALDEVRDRVVEAWTKEKTDEAIAALVERSVKELGAGKPIEEVASDLNQFSVLSQPMTRQGDGTSLFPAQVASAIFAGGPDHYGSAVNGDGDHVVFKVAEVTHAAPNSAPQQMRDDLTSATRNTIYGEFTTALRDDAGLRINQQTLQQLINPTVSGN